MDNKNQPKAKIPFHLHRSKIKVDKNGRRIVPYINSKGILKDDYRRRLVHPKREPKYIERNDEPEPKYVGGNNCHKEFDLRCKEKGIESQYRGWPDRIMIYKDKLICVEIKSLRDELTYEQGVVIKMLQDKGIPCFMYRGESDFFDILDHVLE